MNVTGLSDKQIKEKVTALYFIFEEIQKELEKTYSPEQAKENARIIVAEELLKNMDNQGQKE